MVGVVVGGGLLDEKAVDEIEPGVSGELALEFVLDVGRELALELVLDVGRELALELVGPLLVGSLRMRKVKFRLYNPRLNSSVYSSLPSKTVANM